MESELRDLVGEPTRITRLAAGLVSAGGPVFSRRGYLLFSDTGAGKILRWQDGAVSSYRDGAVEPRGLTFDHQGRLLVCEKGRLVRVEKNGSVTGLAGGSRGPAVRDPTDVVYAIDANIYFCDGAAVYRVHRDGRVLPASRDCERPVGVALSPNQQALYVTDAGRKAVQAYAINPDGALAAGRVFASLEDDSPGGLKTDESGRVWVAGARGVTVFSSDGKPLGAIPFPEPLTNLNWAEGFRNLIVTSRTSVYRMEARVDGTRTY
jgi:gluconolactonase